MRLSSTYEMWDFGVVPRPAVTQVLLQLPAVQEELKITVAQKKEQAESEERRSQKTQHARTEIRDRAKFRAARDAIFDETAAAQLANLKPEQRERLDQLQAQALLTFSLPGRVGGEFRRNDKLAASATRWTIGRQLLYCPELTAARDSAAAALKSRAHEGGLRVGFAPC